MYNDPRLTRRELEVTKLVAKGYSNKEIAFELCLAPDTIKTYINMLYRRFDFNWGNPRIRLTNWYNKKFATGGFANASQRKYD